MDDDQPTRPQPGPPADPWERRLDAETARFPRPEADETPVQPDHTAVLPNAGEPEAPRWTARAGVPVGGPRQHLPPETEWAPPPAARRTWWAPILIVVAILILLGLIGFGLWLATRGQPTPTPSASAAPTSAAPTSAAPSPTPSATPSASPTQASATVPPLVGVSRNDAEQILQSQGLKWKAVNTISDLPVGTVVRTDPGANSSVPAGSTVTLYVASAAPTSASPTGTASHTP